MRACAPSPRDPCGGQGGGPRRRRVKRPGGGGSRRPASSATGAWVEAVVEALSEAFGDGHAVVFRSIRAGTSTVS